MHRLQGQEWAQMRQLVLDRDGHRCTVAEYDRTVLCAPGPLHVHEVDHEADPYDPDNYATACGAHHARWHWLRRSGDLLPRKTHVRRPRRRRLAVRSMQ
jgi:5-methylcytosine-specific restriction endonuclease McrA